MFARNMVWQTLNKLQVKGVSKRILKMRPLDFLARLSRDMEKHLKNLKGVYFNGTVACWYWEVTLCINKLFFNALELQSWLLYYSLPCLVGYLPDKYLGHFIHLAEGVYILLGDGITPVQLAWACDLLQTFNKDFQHLYSKKTQWKSQLYIQILISFCNHYTVGLIRILNPANTSFLFVSCCSCCCCCCCFKVTQPLWNGFWNS